MISYLLQARASSIGVRAQAPDKKISGHGPGLCMPRVRLQSLELFYLGTTCGQSWNELGTNNRYCSYIKETAARLRRTNPDTAPELNSIMNNTKTQRQRSKRGATLVEFACALSVFFLFIFVPLVDISFVPARYMLAYTNLDQVVHRMALCEKRSQAIEYLNGRSWRPLIERWGVTVRNAKASLMVNDETGATRMKLDGGTAVPPSLLPNGTRRGNGEVESKIYSMEIAVEVDVPPLFDSKTGLPGFSRPLTFTLRNRAQWENLSPDPTTSDTKLVRYYINE